MSSNGRSRHGGNGHPPARQLTEHQELVTRNQAAYGDDKDLQKLYNGTMYANSTTLLYPNSDRKRTNSRRQTYLQSLKRGTLEEPEFPTSVYAQFKPAYAINKLFK